MKKPDLSQMTVPELLEQYRELLIVQSEFHDYHGANGKPDVRPWNRYARKIERVHRALKDRGDEGVDAILSLIHHPNSNVRHAAQVHCLKQRTDIVLPLIQAAAESPQPDPTRLCYQLSLYAWEIGKWLCD